MGNLLPKEIKDQLRRLNIILYGNRANTFVKKELYLNNKDIIIEESSENKISYKRYTSENKDKGRLYYDYIMLDRDDIYALKSLVALYKKVVIIYFHPEYAINNYEEKIIKEMSKLETKFHPFIIFCSNAKNKNQEYYKKYINNNNIKFDPLNIYTIKNEDVECGNYKEMYNILSDIESYYNEEENHIMFNNELGINICVLGKPGKGKSSFINCIAEKKIALEGEGSNVTHKFNKYKILKKINNKEYGLLNIYDCPGFSLEGKEIEGIQSLIDEKFTLFKKNHDFIHAFLYFTYNEHNRTLEDKEIKLIEYIKKKLHNYGQDSIILFIINQIETDNSYKKALLSDLKDNFGKEFENENNIIYVNLKNKIIGIDNVFKILYDYFKNYKVQILSERDDIKQRDLINKSIFFKYIEKEEIMINKFRNICEEIVSNYSSQVKTKAKNLEKNEIINLRKEMLKRIEITLESSLYIKDLELHDCEIGKKWYYSIPLLGKWLEGNFMSEQSPNVTKQIGNDFINTHIENMQETSSNEFCLSACKRYNNSIELLSVISELFKVKKEFIIDFKTEVINNDFIIKFTTLFANPSINISIQLLEGFYNFIIKIKNRTNEQENEIIHSEKLTSNFILEKHSIDHSSKTNENGKCYVSIFIKLKSIEFEEV